MPQEKAGLCPNCRSHRPPYRELRSWVVFEGSIRSVLHRLKYRRNIALGQAIARPLTGYALATGWQVDLVVPIPLGERRWRERGYNQVALVAQPLASMAKWKFAPEALRRARETRSQVGLTAVERQENMSDAFKARRDRVEGRSILLVDDVATTGSTLASGASALLVAGASCVYALTIARALPRHGLHVV